MSWKDRHLEAGQQAGSVHAVQGGGYVDERNLITWAKVVTLWLLAQHGCQLFIVSCSLRQTEKRVQ